jgi:adenylosuccinate synthase
MDKVSRLGIRAGDLTDLDGLRQRLRFVLDHKNTVIARSTVLHRFRSKITSSTAAMPERWRR